MEAIITESVKSESSTNSPFSMFVWLVVAVQLRSGIRLHLHVAAGAG